MEKRVLIKLPISSKSWGSDLTCTREAGAAVLETSAKVFGFKQAVVVGEAISTLPIQIVLSVCVFVIVRCHAISWESGLNLRLCNSDNDNAALFIENGTCFGLL